MVPRGSTVGGRRRRPYGSSGGLSPGGSPGVAISEVSRQTGIPVTTLRFYERELPALFRIGKTAGGHRRYEGRDVARFATIRTLTQEGLPLGQLRRVLASPGEHEPLLEALERLAERVEGQARGSELLDRRLEELEGRLRALEQRGRGWFRR